MSKARVHGTVRFWGLAALALAGACVPVSGQDSGPVAIPPPDVAHPGQPGVAVDAGIAGRGPAASGPVVSAAKPPPSISGGTLLVLSGGSTAVAADPDRDAVHIADLKGERLLGSVALQPGDEPGRVVEDGAGLVHVVLRRGGALATIDPRTGTLLSRRTLCSAPRGIAYDKAGDRLHVVCAGGELLSVPPAAGEAVLTARLERDLRDVVVSGDRLLISRFRAADLLTVNAADGKLLSRRVPAGSPAARRPLVEKTPTPTTTGTMGPAAAVSVAWRLVPTPEGGAAMVHQESSNGELGIERGGYGGGPCRSPVAAAVTRFPKDGAPTTSGQVMFAILPVDVAYSPDGKRVAIVSAGNTSQVITRAGGPPVLFTSTQHLEQSECVSGGAMPTPLPDEEPIEFRQPVGEAIAIAFDGQGRVVVQTREPARLEILTHRGGAIRLSEESRADTGHALFHQATGFGLACASCHPEGADDGRVWRFQKIGARRTQNLQGGILETAPFHWDGDMRDLRHLMDEVFTGRMGGPSVSGDHVGALAKWMNALPAMPAANHMDAAAVARGRALFNDAKVGCATCHSGARLTNNTSVAVGTGRVLQVPSLNGVGWRAPFMHTGCAPTLRARFDKECGGGDQHGVTSHLSSTQLDDLVAYMESL